MTKEELKSIYKLDKEIREKQLLLKEIETKETNITIDYSKEKVQSSKLNDSMKYIESKIELESLIKADLQLLYERRKQAYLLISTLKGDEKTVMEKRYITSKKWEEIAIEMGLSYRQVLRLHGRALQKIIE